MGKVLAWAILGSIWFGSGALAAYSIWFSGTSSFEQSFATGMLLGIFTFPFVGWAVIKVADI